MKKSLFTIAIVALFAVAGKAQDGVRKKEAPKGESNQKSETNVQKNSASTTGTTSATTQTTDTKSTGGGTRMAITEKGVPASKAKPKEAAKPAEQPKGQPAGTTEKH